MYLGEEISKTGIKMQVKKEHFSYLHKKLYTPLFIANRHLRVFSEYSPSILRVLCILSVRGKMGRFSFRLIGIVRQGEVNCYAGFLYSQE